MRYVPCCVPWADFLPSDPWGVVVYFRFLRWAHPLVVGALVVNVLFLVALSLFPCSFVLPIWELDVVIREGVRCVPCCVSWVDFLSFCPLTPGVLLCYFCFLRWVPPLVVGALVVDVLFW